MKRFLTPKGAIGVTLVLLMFLTAVVAPLVIPADFATRMTMTARLRPPSALHWLGTDQSGRDVLSRIVWGSRASLTVSALAVLIGLAGGLPIGLIAHRRDAFDLQRILLRVGLRRPRWPPGVSGDARRRPQAAAGCESAGANDLSPRSTTATMMSAVSSPLTASADHVAIEFSAPSATWRN